MIVTTRGRNAAHCSAEPVHCRVRRKSEDTETIRQMFHNAERVLSD
jgi:hypothetical protein